MDIKQLFNWFWNPVSKHYFDFEGRATRQEFWMYVLIYFIIYIVLSALNSKGMLAGIFSLVVFLPSLGITARRLHDVNKSGWWQLIGIIPILGLIVLIIFTVKEGDAGVNQYGASPKGSAGTASAGPSSMNTGSQNEPPRAM